MPTRPNSGGSQSTLDFTFFVLKAFGFAEFEIFLSTRPEKSVGSDEKWTPATSSLEAALRQNIAYNLDEGGGAFYGPEDRHQDQVLTRSAASGSVPLFGSISTIPSGLN
ncbi:MAG: hypothetical protein U0361_12085 [Nitrospiraceae bacterium]